MHCPSHIWYKTPAIPSRLLLHWLFQMALYYVLILKCRYIKVLTQKCRHKSVDLILLVYTIQCWPCIIRVKHIYHRIYHQIYHQTIRITIIYTIIIAGIVPIHNTQHTGTVTAEVIHPVWVCSMWSAGGHLFNMNHFVAMDIMSYTCMYVIHYSTLHYIFFANCSLA